MVPNVRRFNRTRVRLEHSGEIEQTGDFSVLQPHEGSSGTSLRRESPSTGRCRFNRTRVRLELPPTSRPPDRARGFNRTRVRLERAQTSRGDDGDRASTARGFVWNANPPPTDRRVVDASTARGFVWNTRRRSSATSRNWRFNRTRVRLEPTAGPSTGRTATASTARGFVWNWLVAIRHPRRDDASTARGFVWNRGRIPASALSFGPLQPHEGSSGTIGRVQLRHDGLGASTARGFVWNGCLSSHCARRQVASTARGFVWNAISLSPDHVSESLQPHEGSSGTRVALVTRAFPAELQPHEGSSGTGASCPQGHSSGLLQPHEGSSGTVVLQVDSQLGPVASTARGFVWNEYLDPSTDGSHVEQTSARFNRTRVRLEQLSFLQSKVVLPSLQPHEGSSGTPSGSHGPAGAGRFNRTRVRLEPDSPVRGPTGTKRFNRTRVRLELSPPRQAHGKILLQPHEGSSGTSDWSRDLSNCTQLQPHEGSSGTNPQPRRRLPDGKLQPHEGSSGTRLMAVILDKSDSFNRTRVRLERWQTRCGDTRERLLQPHEGSSGTITSSAVSQPLSVNLPPRFPSTLNNP